MKRRELFARILGICAGAAIMNPAETLWRCLSAEGLPFATCINNRFYGTQTERERREQWMLNRKAQS